MDQVLEYLFPSQDFNYSLELKQSAERKLKEAISKGMKSKPY